MTGNEPLDFPTNESVRQTWISWSELLAYPGASPFVADFNWASDGLIRIYDSGFSKTQMEEWEREWPTPLGWEIFLARQNQRRDQAA